MLTNVNQGESTNSYKQPVAGYRMRWVVNRITACVVIREGQMGSLVANSSQGVEDFVAQTVQHSLLLIRGSEQGQNVLIQVCLKCIFKHFHLLLP